MTKIFTIAANEIIGPSFCFSLRIEYNKVM